MMLRRTKEKKHPALTGFATRRVRLVALTAALVVAALSAFYLHYAWTRYTSQAASEAKVLAESVEAFLHPEHIALLSGSAEDLVKPEYVMVKYNLIQLIKKNASIRFAYLFGMQNGDIVMLVDSEPTDSPEYSPPGEVYHEATDVDRSAFASGRTVLTEPLTDRWGTWVSALVPVKDPVTDRIIAVFGIDYPASEWFASLRKRMLPDVVVILSLLILSLSMIHNSLEHLALKERSRAMSVDEALFHGVFDRAPIGIAIGSGGGFAEKSPGSGPSINRMFERIIGRSREEMKRLTWMDITHPDDLAADLDQLGRFRRGEIDGYSMEKRYIRPDGSIVWVNMMIAPLMDGKGADATHLCLLEDITQRKRIEETLKESERSKAVLLSHLPGLAYRCRYDRDWTMEFVSEGCAALTGYAPESLVDNRDLSFNDLISPEYRELLWQVWGRVLRERRSFRYEYEIVTRDGQRKWVLELGQGIYGDDGAVKALEGIVIDISEQKRREAQVSYLNKHDFLTGLYNRRFMDQEKKRLDRERYWPLSVALCNINGVRMVNDAFGHAEGDRLIVEVARLIRSCCGEGEVLGRTSGDEFTLLMPRAGSEAVRQRVQQILFAVESYNRSAPHPYDISLTVGYETKQSGEQDIDRVFRIAEEYLIHRKLLNQHSSHNAIVSSIMATLYARSQETEAHGQRLTRLTGMIGVRLGLSQEDLDKLELLSMLHDIGKVGVDDRILNKPGKLTADEWAQMERHSEIGHRIAMSTPELEHIADYILCHHERWDGTGYPAGKAGEAIPLPARVLAVADAYDAMTEDRVYRKALTREAALLEIERCSGTQFDPAIAGLFVALMRKREGEYSKTNAGKEGSP